MLASPNLSGKEKEILEAAIKTIGELLEYVSYGGYQQIELEERLAKIEQRLGIPEEKQLD